MQNKSKKLTSRLLSALLALACVLTLLPGVAVAAETMTMLKKEEGSMVLEKRRCAGGRWYIYHSAVRLRHWHDYDGDGKSGTPFGYCAGDRPVRFYGI